MNMPAEYQEYRKGNKWVLIWRNPWTGKKRSLSFATSEEAESFVAIQARLAAREKLLLKKSKNARKTSKKITIAELLEKYFAVAHSNQVTIKQSGYHAAHILSALGNRQVYRLVPEDIINFASALKLRGLAQSTINRRVSILRAALNWGKKCGLIASSPLRDLRMPQAKSRRTSPPTPQESMAMLAAAAPHVQRVIVLGLYSGARIGPSELFRLKWQDVDLENAMIRMPNANKNRKPDDGRNVPIRKTLLPLISEWLKHDSSRGIEHIINWQGRSVRCIGHAWHTARAKAGVCRRIRPYDLRHAFATYSLAGKADIGSVAGIMGHADPSMILKVYQHVQEAQKRAAVEALPDMLQLGRYKEKTPGLPE
jgi:integrase